LVARVVFRSSRLSTTRSIERSVQEPRPIFEAAEEPEAAAALRRDDVVIAFDFGVAPPAGADALRAPDAEDRAVLILPAETGGLAFGGEGERLDGDGLGPEFDGAEGPARRAWRGTGGVF